MLKNYYFKPLNRIVDINEMLNRAHRVRTFGGENYINHQNGLFFRTDGKKQLTLSDIYPIAKSVYTTDRRCFGRRRKLNAPLIAGAMFRKKDNSNSRKAS